MQRVRRLDHTPNRPRPEPEPVVVLDVEQVETDGEVTLRLLDNYGRLTNKVAPCQYCEFACVSDVHRGVECRAGITKVCDTNILDMTDPAAHGWAGEEGRPITDKEMSYGHRGSFMVTLELWGSFGGRKSHWEEVVRRHISTGQSKELVVANVIKELRRVEIIGDSEEDIISSIVSSMMGSEDIMDVGERMSQEETELILDSLTDEEALRTTTPRSITVEMDNFSKPHRRYKMRISWMYAPELIGARNYDGTIVKNGWIQSRQILHDIDPPDTIFVPHPDDPCISLTSKCFSLRDHVICPMRRSKISSVQQAAWRSTTYNVDRETARGIARVLGATLRRRAIHSKKLRSIPMIEAILEMGVDTETRKVAVSQLAKIVRSSKKRS